MSEEKFTPWFADWKNNPTFLTDQQLKERYGFRVFDRMREMFAVVTVKGESLRK